MSDEAARLGYSTTHLFTAASDYGVPQRRLRYFMLCHDVKLNFAPSGQTDLPTVYSSLEKVSHANDLQVNCPESVRGIMPSVEQGKNVRSTWDRLYKDDPDLAPSRRPAFLYDRLLGDGVSYTITGGCTKLHPDEDRLITVNEAKALCCYPPSFRFIGGAGSVFAQLGKGVMPPVARWLATNIRRGIETGVKSDHPHETVLTATALTISQGPPSKVKIKL
jgi:site-specific DNA-cytosine methylase